MIPPLNHHCRRIDKSVATQATQHVDVPDVELDPEPISKITRTREDGTKYVEIEYDDGSIETAELKED